MPYSTKIRKKLGKMITYHFFRIVTAMEGVDFKRAPIYFIFAPLVTLNIDWLLFCCIHLVADIINSILSGNMSELIES